MSLTYKPRGDFVLFKAVKVDSVRGIVMPDASEEGEKYIVVAVGPKVEGLQPGDRVFSLGRLRENWILVPGTRDLVLTRETNVALIIEGEDVVREWSGQYKGYVGKAEWNEDSESYCGRVFLECSSDVVTFQSKNLDGLDESLVEVVDDYLKYCKAKLKDSSLKWSNWA